MIHRKVMAKKTNKTALEVSCQNKVEGQKVNEAEELWKEKHDHKSIAAVFNILPDIFEKRIESGEFDQSLLIVVDGYDYTVPLYYVTQAWDVILTGKHWLYSFMIGSVNATRSKEEAVIHNDQMKLVWKKHFGIDIDQLQVNFSKYDMHLPPTASDEEYSYHFLRIPDGVIEWIFYPITHPSEDNIRHYFVSCLMETVAFIEYEKSEIDW